MPTHTNNANSHQVPIHTNTNSHRFSHRLTIWLPTLAPWSKSWRSIPHLCAALLLYLAMRVHGCDTHVMCNWKSGCALRVCLWRHCVAIFPRHVFCLFLQGPHGVVLSPQVHATTPPIKQSSPSQSPPQSPPLPVNSTGRLGCERLRPTRRST